jgi:hypothetical protein
MKILCGVGKVERVSSGLEKIVVSSLRRVPAVEGVLLAWPLACGSAVAERTRAVEFAKSVLRVEVSDAGWKKELQNLAPQYLAVINRYTSESVQRIEFVVTAEKAAGQGAHSRPA